MRSIPTNTCPVKVVCEKCAKEVDFSAIEKDLILHRYYLAVACHGENELRPVTRPELLESPFLTAFRGDGGL